MKNIELKGINYHLLYNKQIIVFLIYILIVLSILKADGKSINFVYFLSEIKLVVKGIGNKNILNYSFIYEPSEVKINGESNNCKKVCSFQNDVNNIVLYFNEIIENCENMFYNLKDIKEIDLSKFDFSNVTSTENMFNNCTLLEKIEFGNINTSSLVTMTSCFRTAQI